MVHREYGGFGSAEIITEREVEKSERTELLVMEEKSSAIPRVGAEIFLLVMSVCFPRIQEHREGWNRLMVVSPIPYSTLGDVTSNLLFFPRNFV